MAQGWKRRSSSSVLLGPVGLQRTAERTYMRFMLTVSRSMMPSDPQGKTSKYLPGLGSDYSQYRVWAAILNSGGEIGPILAAIASVHPAMVTTVSALSE